MNKKSHLLLLLAALIGTLNITFSSCSSTNRFDGLFKEGAVYKAELRKLDWGKDTIFVYGHKTPDVDAVASALSYAKLMRALGYNCKAKVSSPVNRETKYIAQRLNFDLPELKTHVAPQTRLILTDHTDYAQCVEGALEAIILQKIDHHVEGDIPDSKVGYVRREMIGSTCTIIYECYKELGVPIDNETARILLAGIISDTRNLGKTTTRGADSLAWASLIGQLRLENEVADISKQMVEAASNYDDMTDEEIFLSDYKDYDIGGKAIGFGSLVCKATEIDAFIDRMLAVMPQVMLGKRRSMLFAKIDNMIPNPDSSNHDRPYVENGTYFIYYGEGSKAIAEALFGESIREGVIYSSENYSRKQIIPLITKILEP